MSITWRWKDQACSRHRLQRAIRVLSALSMAATILSCNAPRSTSVSKKSQQFCNDLDQMDNPSAPMMIEAGSINSSTNQTVSVPGGFVFKQLSISFGGVPLSDAAPSQIHSGVVWMFNLDRRLVLDSPAGLRPGIKNFADIQNRIATQVNDARADAGALDVSKLADEYGSDPFNGQLISIANWEQKYCVGIG